MEALQKRLLAELNVENALPFDPYKDELQNANIFPILIKEPEVSPKWGGQYVNAEISLLRGDKMTRG